jgi:SynChlorMet cassette radical SAM/SPASM protein ScmF
MDKRQTDAALKNNLCGLPEGVPPLTALYFYVAGSCNLRCRHCWISPEYSKGAEGAFIKPEYVEKAVMEAKPIGLNFVKLTGGEPTLHPHIREIVSIVNRHGIRFGMETNGTLIDSEMAKFFRKNEHFSSISVSIDGIDSETHEFLRAVAGSYDKAITGIRNLVNAGFRPQLICTLHKKNISQLPEIISLAESLGCGSVKFNHLQKMGRGEEFAENYALEIHEIIAAYKRVEQEFAPKTKFPLYFDIPFAFYSIGKLISGRLGRCNVKNILGILADGSISLCGIGSSIPELVFGNIARDNIKDIWGSSLVLQEIREVIPFRLEGICGECLLKEICLGDCVAHNYHKTGKLSSQYWFCDNAVSLGLFPESRKKYKKEARI